MHTLRTIPQVRNVRNFLDEWIATNGKADPREMLDQYFWSYLDTSRRYQGAAMIEIDAWCNDMLGPENWYRQFNKVWFTSESELTMFKLTWSGER